MPPCRRLNLCILYIQVIIAGLTHFEIIMPEYMIIDLISAKFAITLFNTVIVDNKQAKGEKQSRLIGCCDKRYHCAYTSLLERIYCYLCPSKADIFASSEMHAMYILKIPRKS